MKLEFSLLVATISLFSNTLLAADQECIPNSKLHVWAEIGGIESQDRKTWIVPAIGIVADDDSKLLMTVDNSQKVTVNKATLEVMVTEKGKEPVLVGHLTGASEQMMLSGPSRRILCSENIEITNGNVHKKHLIPGGDNIVFDLVREESENYAGILQFNQDGQEIAAVHFIDGRSHW